MCAHNTLTHSLFPIINWYPRGESTHKFFKSVLVGFYDVWYMRFSNSEFWILSYYSKRWNWLWFSFGYFAKSSSQLLYLATPAGCCCFALPNIAIWQLLLAIAYQTVQHACWYCRFQKQTIQTICRLRRLAFGEIQTGCPSISPEHSNQIQINIL